MALSNNPAFDPANLLMLSGNILAGQNFASGVGTGLQQLGTNVAAQQKEMAERQKQMQEQTQAANFLRQQNPGMDLSNYTPGMINAAASTTLEKQLNPAKPEFKVLPDGTYGTWDGSKFNTLGKASRQDELPAAYRDFQLQQTDPAYAEHIRSTSKTGQTFEERKRMAEELGMTPDDPAYKPFIATGKFPREDQQTLTAVDKKAILDADEMVAVNQGAIDALKQAKSVSKDANAGWLSGTRATIGANLPDYLVPDMVSSPESSTATQNFDNAIVGQALTQLKAIFGGAPTEGERKILLDLQGSSNLQPEVREQIIDRAIAAAERRLEFNRQRADELRGNTYYKPRDGQQTPNNPTGGQTKTGIKFSVEP
jgi:hypothetical protein